MVTFTTHKISARLDKLGAELKQARLEKEITLEQAAKELQINRAYLEALEQGQLEKLPAGVYGKNFLREYAHLLQLDIDEYRNLLLGAAPGEDKKKQTFIFSQAIPHITNFLAVPRIIKNILIIMAIIICIAYLGFRLQQIISPPALTITNPVDNMTTTENIVLVQGFTELEAEVKINGETVLIDTAGNFTQPVNLKSGLNAITIVAKKKYSRDHRIDRNIIVHD